MTVCPKNAFSNIKSDMNNPFNISKKDFHIKIIEFEWNIETNNTKRTRILGILEGFGVTDFMDYLRLTRIDKEDMFHSEVCLVFLQISDPKVSGAKLRISVGLKVNSIAMTKIYNAFHDSPIILCQSQLTLCLRTLSLLCIHYFLSITHKVIYRDAKTFELYILLRDIWDE